MKKATTSFIIGAGAHVPYGFPTGKGLRSQILNSKVNASVFDVWNIEGYSSTRFEEFCDVFNLSNIISIDKFLTLNPKYIIEGKVAIAHSIQENEKYNFRKVLEDQWIQYLYNRLIEDLIDVYNIEHIWDTHVNFFTFNYDRLLDWGILISLINTFKSDEEIEAVYKSKGFEGIGSLFDINIEHIYGSIGNLDSNPIGSDTYLHINESIGNLLLINERQRDMKKIITKLEKSDVIFIVGYGFNKENNDLLDLKRVLNGKHIYATGVGLLEEEIDRISQEIGCRIYTYDTYELIRRFLA